MLERSFPPEAGRPQSGFASNTLTARRVAVFCFAAALLALLAIDGGGYDIVVRQKVAFVLWLLVAVGFAFRILPVAQPHGTVLMPAAAALALLVWLAVSLTWTESAERTGTELTRLLGYLGVLVLAVACVDRRTFGAAASGVSVAAIFVTGIALSSRLFPELFPEATDVARLSRAPDRLNFPLDYWNAVGAWSAMAIAVGLAWSAHARSEVVRALALAAVPACGVVVYLTYSRAAAVAAVVAVVATFLLSRNRRTVALHALAAGAGSAVVILVVRGYPEIADATGGAGGAEVSLILAGIAALCAVAALATRRLGTDRPHRDQPETTPARRRRPVLLGLAGLALVAALLAATGTASEAWEEFRSDESAREGGDPATRLTSLGGNRADLWDSAWAAFEEHPWGGTGAGTFEFWWSRDARDGEFVRDAHSLYLEALAELGWPGFLLVLAFLGGSLALALRMRARLRDPNDVAASVAMVAVFFVFLVTAGVDWMWEETAVAVLALAAIGIAWAAGSTELTGEKRMAPLGWPGVRLAIIGVALLAAAAQVPGLIATERVRESQRAARHGDIAASRTLAEDAVEAQPWAATQRFQLALVLEAEGRLAEAQAEIEEAISKERTNWRYPLLLARILTGRGQLAEARGTFLRGRELRPLSPAYGPSSPYAQAIFTPAQLERLGGG